MRATTMPFLDCRFFPHLWDSILASLDRSDVLNLRFVCQCLKTAVDKSLCFSEGDLEMRENDRIHHYGGLEESTLPFFSPWSPECSDMQLYAVQQAGGVKIDIPSSPRVNHLLQMALGPEEDVTGYHLTQTTSSARTEQASSVLQFKPLPPCSIFQLWMDIPCGCRCGGFGGTWSHSAEWLYVDFLVGDTDPSSWTSDCIVLDNLITPTVEHLGLTISASETAVEAVLRLLVTPSQKRSHNLRDTKVIIEINTVCGTKERLAERTRDTLARLGFNRKLVDISIRNTSSAGFYY